MKYIIEFLKLITWQKYLMMLLTAVSALVLWMVYENRTVLYPTFPMVQGSYTLGMPNEASRKLIEDFVKKYPEVGLLTVIQADPVANRRSPVYRHFNSDDVKKSIESSYATGKDGSGPLFSADQVSNEQVLSVLSGELRCEPVTEGMFAKLFPDLAAGAIVHSCRVPIPPSFSLVGGWIAIHLKTWPPRGQLDAFKQDALILALNYYKSELGYGPNVVMKGK